MTIQHRQRIHKSRKNCPFLTDFKWSTMFYPTRFLTFLLWLLCRWVTGHWSPCSATCEKGVQHREVTCVYQLQNGTYVNTRDLYCLGNKPTTVQSCEGRDCLSIWEASEWSKVGTWFQKGARRCPFIFDIVSVSLIWIIRRSFHSWCSAYSITSLIPDWLSYGTVQQQSFLWEASFPAVHLYFETVSSYLKHCQSFCRILLFEICLKVTETQDTRDLALRNSVS